MRLEPGYQGAESDTIRQYRMERIAGDPAQLTRSTVNMLALVGRRSWGRIFIDKAPWPRPLRARQSRVTNEAPVYNISELSKEFTALAVFSDDKGNEVTGPLQICLQHAPEDHLVTWFLRKAHGELW